LQALTFEDLCLQLATYHTILDLVTLATGMGLNVMPIQADSKKTAKISVKIVRQMHVTFIHPIADVVMALHAASFDYCRLCFVLDFTPAAQENATKTLLPRGFALVGTKASTCVFRCFPFHCIHTAARIMPCSGPRSPPM
jgi:hypothetical protein